MKSVILDTNVGLVAMGAFEEDGGRPTDKLRLWCVDALARIMYGQTGLVIDKDRAIVNEYLNKMPHFPLGEQFVYWLNRSMWAGPTVVQVKIHKVKNGYTEFPVDSKLSEFDMSDRKFIAVAVANKGRAPILEATDGKWWKWSKCLKGHGVKVEFGDECFAKKLCQKKNKCEGDCDACNG